MVRILNFFCVALMGLTILGLYQVSEKTRVARMQLNQATRQIAEERGHIAVLQTEWQHVASPDHIQQLAQSRLGMSDNASVQLSAFAQLPRRGDAQPLGNSPVRNASAQLPAPPPPAAIPVSETSDSVPGL